MAVLTLADLEMLLANHHADKMTLRGAVERMESERTSREFGETELTVLGLGHLNLRNLQYGYNYLHEASQLNPNNVVLAGQVNSLLIRLEEIKQQDLVNQAMPKGKTILVVDDSPTVRKLIAGKLEKCGHDVFCSNDGVEAMERLADLRPDLILLDITMPRMDGYQVCKLIRSNAVTKDVPVVMISGKDGFFDKVRGRMAGSSGYITKPFGPETLMKAVETYLRPDA
jgi:twitching motility two-component system response regulator PilG